jgi:modulator of FtsH protease HflK
MPMNEQPPWGKKKKPSTPEDYFAALIQKIRDFFDEQGKKGAKKEVQPNGGDSEPPPNIVAGLGKIALLILAIVILRGVFSSFYTIEPGEQGVVLRFGKYTRTAEPGLNFKIPYMEDMVRVDVKTVRKEEFGFRTRVAGSNTMFNREGYDLESLMLTGDKNVIEVAWIVQYTVNDPVKFVFTIRDVPQAVRDNSETVIRRIVGNMDFDYVLGNRSVLANMAQQQLQAGLDNLYLKSGGSEKSGISILTLQLLDITPTDEVKPAFNEVNEADQDMRRLVNEAEEQYNRVIPRARGSAQQIIEESYGYAAQRVNAARGEIFRFNALVAEYEKAQAVTRQRMYLETMQKVLPGVKQMYIMDNSRQNVLPFLNLSDGTPAASPQPLRERPLTQ